MHFADSIETYMSSLLHLNEVFFAVAWFLAICKRFYKRGDFGSRALTHAVVETL